MNSSLSVLIHSLSSKYSEIGDKTPTIVVGAVALQLKLIEMSIFRTKFVYKYLLLSFRMLDLDAKKPCPICTYNVSYLSEFISQNHARLAKRLSKDALYTTMHQLVEENRIMLERQGKTVPKITEDDIRKHYTLHEISLATVLVEDLRAVRELQRKLLEQKSPPIGQVLQLSRTSVSLLSKLDKIKSVPIAQGIYKYN